MAKNDFIGTWRLVSYEYIDPEGELRLPFGEHPEGYLVYSGDGYMSVNCMNPDWSGYLSAQKAAPPALKLKDIFNHHYFAYSGRYEITDDRVIHHIEICSLPDWVGIDLQRYFNFEGNRLTLVADTAVLVWEKASD